ncbi:MAG: response regulator [Elusimicrobiota bacterium]
MAQTVLGTYRVAELCHVSPMTIGRWIKEGKLKSFKTAGGQHRVWAHDLIELMCRLDMPIPPALESATARRILIVDDEVKVRRVLARYIREFYPEAEVVEAEDGFDAGKKAATLIPAVMVLDINLPGVNGFEVCRAIRGDAKLRAIKILAISGYNVDEWRDKALQAGADAFLAKPFEEDALRKALAKLLSSRRKK